VHAPRPAIALTGPPGSGKSSTGRELATRLGAALLDLDTLTNPLVDVVLDSLGGQGYDDRRVAPLVRDARYDCLVGVAQECLRVGAAVVMVAPFTTERKDQRAWTRLAGRLSEAGGDPHLVWLRISADALSERLRARGAGRDLDKLQDLEAYVSSVDLSPPDTAHLVVDAADRPSHQARLIERHIYG
jgi:predicted kinase